MQLAPAKLKAKRILPKSATLTWLAELNTQNYPPDVRRRLKILNVVSYYVAFFTGLYVVQHFFVDPVKWFPVIVINFLAGVAALSVPLWHKWNDIAGALFLASVELAVLFFLTMFLGRESGVHIQYSVFAAVGFVVLGFGRLKLISGILVIAFFLHLACWFLFPSDTAVVLASETELRGIYIGAAVTTFGLIAATVYYAFSLAEAAKAETDALLRNILPARIVEQLKANPDDPISESVDGASVLFSDLKGFVSLSRQLGPDRTVALLNDLMRALDRQADVHGVTKIKTIGDAYMAATGVLERRPDDADRLLRFGFAMLEVAEEIGARYDVKLEKRIGISTGPVMAGVIGAQRTTYDIWGDTVNLAARLEHADEPGRILTERGTCDAIEDGFTLIAHGKIDVKGVGLVDTWFVEPS